MPRFHVLLLLVLVGCGLLGCNAHDESQTSATTAPIPDSGSEVHDPELRAALATAPEVRELEEACEEMLMRARALGLRGGDLVAAIGRGPEAQRRLLAYTPSQWSVLHERMRAVGEGLGRRFPQLDVPAPGDLGADACCDPTELAMRLDFVLGDAFSSARQKNILMICDQEPYAEAMVRCSRRTGLEVIGCQIAATCSHCSGGAADWYCPD